MKTLNTLLIAASMVALTSCGTTKETTKMDTATKTSQNRGRSNQTISPTINSNTMDNGRSRTKANSRTATARENEAARGARMKKMYTDLNMTDAQIKTYDSKWKSAQTNWKRNNNGEEMTNYVRVEAQDKLLKEILDTDQFANYQQWMREHAGEN